MGATRAAGDTVRDEAYRQMLDAHLNTYDFCGVPIDHALRCVPPARPRTSHAERSVAELTRARSEDVHAAWRPWLRRQFLASFVLPAESQQIDRIMERFAARYHATNPGEFSSAGARPGLPAPLRCDG